MNVSVPMASQLASLPQYVCCSRPPTFRGGSGREEEFLSAVSRSLRRLGAHETITTSSSRVSQPLAGYLVMLDSRHADMLRGAIDLNRCLAVVIRNLEQLCADPSAVPQVEVHGSLAAFAEAADLVGTEQCAAEWFVAQTFATLYEAD